MRFAALIVSLTIPVAGSVVAQETPYIKSWVKRTAVVAEQPFNLFVEASGKQLTEPDIPHTDGLFVSTTNPRRVDSVSVHNGETHHKYSIAYIAKASTPGPLTIPPISATIDGQVLKTDPIELTVHPAKSAEPAQPKSASAHVDRKTVTVGEPFWIYLQASGHEVDLPGMVEVEGLRIDPNNVQHSVSYSITRKGSQATAKRGFRAVALQPGTILIPGFAVTVNGATVITDPIEITAREKPATDAGESGSQVDTPTLTQEDLVFIRMHTDKDEVYQGEPILLTKQLWRIKYDRISTGPYRGQLIEQPTTEGFYTFDLPPATYSADYGPWEYDVLEERKLLYPTAVGDLKVGRWHWEGVALVARRGFLVRDRLHYKLDAGPIEIHVKPLPQRPRAFNGAVGQFDAEAALSRDAVTQGVPITLKITIRGQGNPDAIGAPPLAPLTWANVSEPKRDTRSFTAPDALIPTIVKSFTYEITPHTAGDHDIPELSFVHFDPQAEEYKEQKLGPFGVAVAAGRDGNARVVADTSVALSDGGVDILAEDINSVITDSEGLRRDRGMSVVIGLVLILPPIIYGLLALVAARRRRLTENLGMARAYRARSKVLKQMEDVVTSSHPADALYRALTEFIGDIFNTTEQGVTSADVDTLLRDNGVDDDLREQGVKILKACERVRYGTQDITKQELAALVNGAEAFIDKLDAASRKGAGK